MQTQLGLLMSAGLFFLCGCSTTGRVSAVPEAQATGFEFDRSEYIVLDSVEGKACVTTSCFLFSCSNSPDKDGEDLFQGRLTSNTGSIQGKGSAPFPFNLLAAIFGGGGGGPPAQVIAESMATYRAIESAPSADAILTPRKSYNLESTNFFIGSSSESCVTIRGKAIRIKTDRELNGTPPPPAPPPAPAPAPPAPSADAG